MTRLYCDYRSALVDHTLLWLFLSSTGWTSFAFRTAFIKGAKLNIQQVIFANSTNKLTELLSCDWLTYRLCEWWIELWYLIK